MELWIFNRGSSEVLLDWPKRFLGKGNDIESNFIFLLFEKRGPAMGSLWWSCKYNPSLHRLPEEFSEAQGELKNKCSTMVDRSVSKCNAFKFFCAKAPPHCLHLFSGCLPPQKKENKQRWCFVHDCLAVLLRWLIFVAQFSVQLSCDQEAYFEPKLKPTWAVQPLDACWAYAIPMLAPC